MAEPTPDASTSNPGADTAGAPQPEAGKKAGKGDKVANKGPKKEWVRAVHGRLLHLHTNEWFGADPKRVEIDGFTQSQIAAGKLEVVDMSAD